MNRGLSNIWIKASILGTIWASFEIVFGSFLHNLKIPFSGNILTSVGIIVLISVSYKWKEKGLFWRAGLITAVMKTMSPSAVIFGPMIAIFTESLLIELSTCIFGRTVIGYLIGSALAMSWNLVQKIINLIIFYGNNIVDIYKKLIEIAQDKLNLHQVDMVWIPILLLFLIYTLFGIFAGFVGMRVGRAMRDYNDDTISIADSGKAPQKFNVSPSGFPYSLSWFYADFLLIVISLFILSLTNWTVWMPFTIILVVVWSVRYKRALKQIMRPKFWIWFVMLTMLITLLFQSEITLSDRILIGVKMNFRAAIIILGFTVLGTELYNPIIKKFFNKSAFRQLSLALELSFESLPKVISEVPDLKSLIRNPVNVLKKITSTVDERLKRDNTKVFIITGSVASGKTSGVKELVKMIEKLELRYSGFYSERIVAGDTTIGYDLVNVENGERRDLLRAGGKDNQKRIGKYTINVNGFNYGKKIIKQGLDKKVDLIIIDEVGKLELENKGWSECVDEVIKSHAGVLIITVRDSFVQDVIKKWKINKREIFSADKMKISNIVESIILEIKSDNPD